MITITDVAARTKVCTLSLSAWRATRVHKPETKAENARHGTNAARVSVRLCEHQALTDLQALHYAAYTLHRRLTLPTVQDGMRLLPVGRELEHASEMAKFRAEHDRLTSTFLADYPAEVSAASFRLNGLHDESMWPAVDKIAGKFGFSTKYLATPTEGAWCEWLEESVRAADSELRERLTEALERVRDRCAGDGPLHATVFSALSDLIALAPDLDLACSPEIQATIASAGPLANMTADEARKDKALRAQAAAQAERMLSVLGGLS
jgi:hypothetical protein